MSSRTKTLPDIGLQPEDYDFQRHDPLAKLTGYRPDAKQKSGLATLPSNLDYGYNGRQTSPTSDHGAPPADIIRRNLEALRYARSKGYELPKEASDPKFLTALLLKEDRSDFGAGSFDTNNEDAINAFNAIGPRFGATPARFVAAMVSNHATAQKNNIPFTTAWNGTGSNGFENKGEYTDKFGAFINAAQHPANKPLYDFVDQHLNGEEYTTPLPLPMVNQINDVYKQRQKEAEAKAAETYGPMTELRHKVFGHLPILGVPAEMDLDRAAGTVTPPDFNELTKQVEPQYKRGGAIERTTHDRKIL